MLSPEYEVDVITHNGAMANFTCIGLCGASVRSLWFFIIYQHLLQADKIKNGLQMKQCL